MNTVKTRKVGNSLAVTIPKSLHVEEGTEFVVSKGRNNVIMLVPKISNPFDGVTDLRMGDDFEGVQLLNDEW